MPVRRAVMLVLLAFLASSTSHKAQAWEPFDLDIEELGCSGENWSRSQAESQAAGEGVSVDELLAWRGACESAMAHAMATEEGISYQAALSRLRENPPSYSDYWLTKDRTDYERRERELNNYLSDRDEAGQRGIDLESLIAERIATRAADRRESERQAEALRKAEERQQSIINIFALGAMLLVGGGAFVARKRLHASASRWWRRKSKAFRVWMFGSFGWTIGVVLFVVLVDPYDEGGVPFGTYELMSHMVAIMAVPPAFLGALWFGYQRFVR